MRLKSYFAGTVESAICLARQEMGGDAMLVSSRKAQPESRHLGAYEVVFAAAQEPAKEAAAARIAALRPAKADAAATPSAQALAGEMAEMRRQFAKISGFISRSVNRNGHRTSAAFNPALDDMDQVLVSNEVEAELASTILRSVEALGPGMDVRHAFRKDIQRRITVAAELSARSFDRAVGSDRASAGTVVALVGPPGAGKTTMLAKLAVRYGISARRSTHILSYDSHRIACGEQLRSYAAILGVGFEVVDSAVGLAQSLKENSRKDLILIDTPGYSEGDFDLSWELTEFLSTYPHADIHLVLSCASKSSDISRMVDRYNVFGAAKLLFTRLDETDSYGAILNESIRTGLPVSFLGTGPRVPDDLEPATKDRIAGLLLEGRETRAVATA